MLKAVAQDVIAMIDVTANHPMLEHFILPWNIVGLRNIADGLMEYLYLW